MTEMYCPKCKKEAKGDSSLWDGTEELTPMEMEEEIVNGKTITRYYCTEGHNWVWTSSGKLRPF